MFQSQIGPTSISGINGGKRRVSRQINVRRGNKLLTSLVGTQIGVPSFKMPASTVTPHTIGSRELNTNCGKTCDCDIEKIILVIAINSNCSVSYTKQKTLKILKTFSSHSDRTFIRDFDIKMIPSTCTEKQLQTWIDHVYFVSVHRNML